MPKSSIRESFDMETRNRFTKVECEVVILIDGKELPNAAVMGEALDKCIALVQATVSESYKVVPPRVDTPMASPTGKSEADTPVRAVPPIEQTPTRVIPPEYEGTPTQPEPLEQPNVLTIPSAFGD